MLCCQENLLEHVVHVSLDDEFDGEESEICYPDEHL